MGAIARICHEKTTHLPADAGNDIARAVSGIEHWRCISQFAAVNGQALKDWPAMSRPRAVSETWENLRLHWQLRGLSDTPAFAAATVKAVRFSLGH